MSEGSQPTAAARHAAALLVEALELEDDVETVAAELVLVEDAPPQSTFAAEFESSAGIAAFLIYVFSFVRDNGSNDRGGRVLFDEALNTLLTAAERGAPGPRVVAHVVDDDVGMILATSPATLRALRGETAEAEPKPTWQSPAARTKERREQAERLLRALRAADRAAERWLAAAGEDLGSATPAEVELALFLNDERSIRYLLRALNLVLSATPKVD